MSFTPKKKYSYDLYKKKRTRLIYLTHKKKYKNDSKKRKRYRNNKYILHFIKCGHLTMTFHKFVTKTVIFH